MILTTVAASEKLDWADAPSDRPFVEPSAPSAESGLQGDEVKAKRLKFGVKVEESVRRDKWINAWLRLLLSASLLCSLSAEYARLSFAQAYERLRLVLFDRRTGTLAARLHPIMLLNNWMDLANLVWPPTVENLYEYFKQWATGGHAASRAKRTLEALRFIEFFSGADTNRLTCSRLLSGYAAEQFARLGSRKQAEALKVWLITMLSLGWWQALFPQLK